MIWKSSSSSDSGKIFESLPVNNAGRCESDICLEFGEKIPVSGDTLIAIFNKPLMRKVCAPLGAAGSGDGRSFSVCDYQC